MRFRHWLTEMWLQHKDEYLDMGLVVPEKDLSQYFKQYKYWLKREYKHQMNKS
jgi:hypothetical protein